MSAAPERITRRELLRRTGCAAGVLGFGGLAWLLGARSETQQMRWQIDPHKCIACGNCASYCVLKPSAVKCAHAFAMCGYCKLCTGYFDPEPNALNTGAENQLCPTGAIQRNFVEDPYFEYTIDKDLCIGCGKCVEGCTAFGNGSLFLQVSHDLCVNCNDCAIAAACPSEAYVRVPAETPYLPKDKERKA